MKRVWCLLWVLLLPACAGPARQGATTAAPGFYCVDSEGSFPPVPQMSPGAPTARLPDATIGRATGAPASEVSTISPSGLRVQVLAAQDLELALDARHKLEILLGTTVYVRYLEPFHKVQVDCPDPDACEALRNRLRQSGFQSAWIVRPGGGH